MPVILRSRFSGFDRQTDGQTERCPRGVGKADVGLAASPSARDGLPAGSAARQGVCPRGGPRGQKEAWMTDLSLARSDLQSVLKTELWFVRYDFLNTGSQLLEGPNFEGLALVFFVTFFHFWGVFPFWSPGRSFRIWSS